MGIYRKERRTSLGDSELVIDLAEFEAHIELSGCCPVQGFGTAFGREVYFRARHDTYTNSPSGLQFAEFAATGR